jgi:hypothetical protein
MFEYVFPTADESAPTVGSASLAARYFSTAQSVFARSLAESEAELRNQPGYSSGAIEVRRLYQAKIGAIVAALSPSYGPEFLQDVRPVAEKLLSALPADSARLARLTAARVEGRTSAPPASPLDAIALAVSRGDIGEAERLLKMIDDQGLRNAAEAMIVQVSFRQHLREEDSLQALLDARRIADPMGRALMYSELVAAASAGKRVDIVRIAASDAEVDLARGEPDGVKLRALLALVPPTARGQSEVDSFRILRSAVDMLNKLTNSRQSRTSNSNPAVEEAPEIESIADEPLFERAFAAVFDVNPDEAAAAADSIKNPTLRLLAQLECIVPAARGQGAKVKGPGHARR